LKCKYLGSFGDQLWGGIGLERTIIRENRALEDRSLREQMAF
jgi:hypothetical protein